MCGSTSFTLLGVRLSASQGCRPKKVPGIAISVKKCDCGLIFSDPQPIPRSLSDHYSVPPESYWLEAQLGEIDPHVAESIAAAKRLLPFRPGMTALDVGAGQGQSMKAFSDAGFDTYGIEPSAAFHSRLDGSRVKLASAEDADFPPLSFDFISFGAVLEHIYSPSLALERALQWLKPNGIIHIHVPSSRWLIAKILNGYYRIRGTNYVTHLSPMHAPFHLYEFEPECFRRNGRRLGYEIAEVQVSVCYIPYFPLKRAFKWIMEQTGTGLMLTVYLRKSV